MSLPRHAALVGLALFLLAAMPARSTGTYQEPAAFLAEIFGHDVPAPGTLWIDAGLREAASAVLGHAPRTARIRYWQAGDRFAWILEEIGREQPITVGIVTADDRILQLRVLVFRESRGWEVRHPFFTDQFKGLGLTGDHDLDGPVDGISGATLSVSALQRLARFALLLHRAAAGARTS